jgi:hypothetical protein
LEKVLDDLSDRAYNSIGSPLAGTNFHTAMKRITTIETTATAMPAAMWSFAVKHGDIVAC